MHQIDKLQSVDEFLLTRPLRDVTIHGISHSKLSPISTHTPLAGRDQDSIAVPDSLRISTHTPLAGRD